MGLFHKAPKENDEIPIDEVQKMTKRGMSDKDIIKHLKSKGYSYEAIESAMLKAVKDNVNDEPAQRMQTESPAMDNMFEPQDFSFSDMMQPEMPELPPEDMQAPEIMLEELVEGIVSDKWRKFDDQMKKMDENFDRMRAEIKQFELKLDQSKKESPSRDLDIRMADISDQLEDLEARVGGLEKAFKQFLPSLTRNIEALSRMIHEMKEKQVMHEEEI